MANTSKHQESAHLRRIAQLLGCQAAADFVGRARPDSGSATASRGEAQYLSPVEVAHLLGKSVRTVRRWIADGRLPSTRVGGSRLVALADIERVLASGSENR